MGGTTAASRRFVSVRAAALWTREDEATLAAPAVQAAPDAPPAKRVAGADEDTAAAKRSKLAGQLRVKRLSEHAKLPTRGSPGAAGHDLYSAEECVIPARGKHMVKTDISIAIPQDCYARVAPRSGLAWRHSIDTGAGVVDSDYRGPVNVILFNFSDSDFQVSKGDRVAQLILERILIPEVVECDKLDDTERGAGGFGSTGGFGSKS